MKYTKVNYQIVGRFANGNKYGIVTRDEVEGYTVEGLKEVGIRKRNGFWYVDHITTGLAIVSVGSKTREAAVKEYMENWADKLQKVMTYEAKKAAVEKFEAAPLESDVATWQTINYCTTRNRRFDKIHDAAKRAGLLIKKADDVTYLDGGNINISGSPEALAKIQSMIDEYAAKDAAAAAEEAAAAAPAPEVAPEAPAAVPAELASDPVEEAAEEPKTYGKKDVYAEVTNRIIEALEAGVIPWERPWTGVRSGAISHKTGRAYSLLNQMILGKPGEYITFNQCKAEGGRVKKGAKSKWIVFWKVLVKPVLDENGNQERDENGLPKVKGIPVLKYYNVFHIDDCTGIKPKWEDKLPETPAESNAAAEVVFLDYLKREGIELEQVRSNEAYYSPLRDMIHLPLAEQFDNTGEYYSTVFHEATHSTGHKTRLNRLDPETKLAAFGSEDYSKEELVAEMGAACILNELGLETVRSFRNNAAYIQSWLRALKKDKKLIVSAAARAEKAVKMVLNINDVAAEGAE